MTALDSSKDSQHYLVSCCSLLLNICQAVKSLLEEKRTDRVIQLAVEKASRRRREIIPSSGPLICLVYNVRIIFERGFKLAACDSQRFRGGAPLQPAVVPISIDDFFHGQFSSANALPRRAALVALRH